MGNKRQGLISSVLTCLVGCEEWITNIDAGTRTEAISGMNELTMRMNPSKNKQNQGPTEHSQN